MLCLEKIAIILMSMIALTMAGLGSIHRSYEEFIPEKQDCCSHDEVDWSLNLTAVGITALFNGFVKNKFLTHLILDNNRIQEIAEDAFSSVPSLTYLSLENNQLSNLDLKLFLGLKNLKTLILSRNADDDDYNNYGINDEDIFLPRVIPSITHLYVENINMRPSLFGSYTLPSLTHLYVSYNPGMWTEETISRLGDLAPAMTHLYAKGCGITGLDISELSNVTSLYLDENSIGAICNHYCPGLILGTEIAEQFSTLSVSHNNIRNIEVDVFRYAKNLVTLDLSYNQISRLEEGTFDTLERLETLNLDNNLNLGLNAIATLGTLRSLKSLSLQKTNILNINSNYFQNLPTLNKLVLSYNQISTIDSGSFSELANLKELHLAGNKLSSIPYNCLPNSGSLIHLKLDDNMFTNMDDIPLNNTPKILHLCIKNNPITITSMRWYKNAPENLTIFWGDTCPQL